MFEHPKYVYLQDNLIFLESPEKLTPIVEFYAETDPEAAERIRAFRNILWQTLQELHEERQKIQGLLTQYADICKNLEKGPTPPS